MEEYKIEKDINVFCVTAESFPAGIMPAFEKLHSMLPTPEGRNFFGISWPDKDQIIYKAAVEESYAGEAEKYGCERFTIRKGKYKGEKLVGWRKDTSVIGKTFEKLMSGQHFNSGGYCLEIYHGDDEMDCVVIDN